MIRKVLILFMLASYAVSDYCVTYTFEENFHEWLADGWPRACVLMPSWVVGNYSDLGLTGLNERSTSFIKPLPELSCVLSFDFFMNIGGTLEVNIYMEPTAPSDQVIVLANLLDVTGDRVTGMETHSPLNPNFVPGWHTMTIPLTGSETYKGYISFMGMASPNSIVLVDSFRYIPPGMDESECQIYEEITTPDPITTTPEPETTTTTPEPETTTTTPEPETTTTTPEPETTTTTTPEPETTTTTPEPETTTTTPEPETTTTTPEPETTTTTPEPDTTTTTPEPETTTTTPVTTTPEDTASDPTTPDPTTIEETTPENKYRYLLTIELWIKTKLLKNKYTT